MSMSKRLMFDPEYAPLRQAHAEAVIEAFQHRIPTRRKNKGSARPHWDPLWPGAISSAAAELGVSCIHVNDGICFEHQSDRDRVRDRAEALWQKQHDHYAGPRGSGS